MQLTMGVERQIGVEHFDDTRLDHVCCQSQYNQEIYSLACDRETDYLLNPARSRPVDGDAAGSNRSAGDA